MITTSTVLFGLALGVSASDYRHSYPLPDLTAPSGWGVNIHFTDPAPGEIEKLANAGFKWVRMDFGWAGIERQAGQFDFSAYDRLMASLKSVGVRPVFILDYGNDLYEKGSPRSEKSRQAFCRFVAASLKHFRRQGVIWEMWNEPNISFWQPKPNVDEYVALAKAVGETIRRTTPDEWYVGPGVSTFDWSFLQKCIDDGLLRYWDAVSTHPYRGTEPETVANDWFRLRRMIDEKAPKGKFIPMFSSEWGYSDISDGIGVDRQGEFAGRQYLTNLMCGAPLSILYDWKNDGTSRTDPESNFGSMTTDLQPKPAYLEVQRISHELAGFTFKMRLVQDSSLYIVLAFQKDKAVKYAAWTTSKVKLMAHLHLGPDSRDLLLTERPAIWPSSNPAMVSTLKRLPEMLDVGDRTATAAQISKLVEGEAHLAPATPPHRTTIRRWGEMDAPLDLKANRSELVQRITDRLSSNWSSRPQVLRIAEVMSNGEWLARDVKCIQSRPVNVDVIIAKGHPWMVIHNPSRRPFTGQCWWPKSTTRQLGQFKSSGEVEEIHPVDEGPTAIGSHPLVVILKELDPTGARADAKTYGMTSYGPFLPTALDRFSSEPSGRLDESRYALTQDGDPKIPVEMAAKALIITDGPLKGAEGVRIDYRFSTGWKFLELHARGDLSKPIGGGTWSLNMFVKGNASGDSLLMRFSDASGQVFQPSLGNIDWMGWKFVSFRLDGIDTWHWGGAGDGVVHAPIRLGTLALVDSNGNAGKPESVTIAGITLIGTKKL
jgi:hypothetical protein